MVLLKDLWIRKPVVVRKWLVFVVSGLGFPFLAEGAPRVWTDVQGRQIEAVLIGVNGAAATVVRSDGILFDLKAERISAGDKAFIREWVSENAGTIGTLPLPVAPVTDRVQVRLPEVESLLNESGQNIYRTEHFEFRCSEKLSRGLVQRFSLVFEATYAAVQALPIGLNPTPKEDGYWVVLLYEDREAFVAEGGHPSYGAQYDRSSGRVMVPLNGVGVERSSSGLTYTSEMNPTTIIHEVTHQLMHPWLIAGLPPWLVEGFAGYMQSLPYENGIFRMRSHDMKEYLRVSRARDFGPAWPLVSVENLLQMPREQWNGTVVEDVEAARKNYYSAALLVYFFMNYDGGGDFMRIVRYFQALRAGVDLQRRNNILLDGRTFQELETEIIRSFGYRGIDLVADDSRAGE